MNIVAVSISEKKGEKKVNQPEITLVPDHGVQGDAHADGTHRQLSLLGMEAIEYMRQKGADVYPGDFAENITTAGIELSECPVGSRFAIGDSILLELTQIGKECHQGCAIMQQVGSCVMPKRGVFCRILQGGVVRPGDEFRLIERGSGIACGIAAGHTPHTA